MLLPAQTSGIFDKRSNPLLSSCHGTRLLIRLRIGKDSIEFGFREGGRAKKVATCKYAQNLVKIVNRNKDYQEMPTVLRIGSFRFHFYSDEANEPPHVHVAAPDGECKFWLEPIILARNKGVDPKTVRKIEKSVFEHFDLLREKYNEFHRG